MSPGPATTAVVVIADGSRNAQANDAHRAVCAALAERTGAVVEPAFLELEAPTLGVTVAKLVADGATRIHVLPLFLYPGRHMQLDVPALVHEARRDHPGVAITIGRLFGADPALIDVLAAQLPGAAEDR